jgi:hypothetical protein
MSPVDTLALRLAEGLDGADASLGTAETVIRRLFPERVYPDIRVLSNDKSILVEIPTNHKRLHLMVSVAEDGFLMTETF